MLKKITKRILKVILWAVAIFIAFDFLIVTLIFIPPIQQFALSKVSKILTNITGGEITMDKIYLSPFLTLTAKNVTIKDGHHNNMIFATKLKGKINFAQTGKERVCLSFARLDDGEVVIRKYVGEDRVNIAIWAEGFKKKDKKESKFKLLFENIELNDVRFVFINDDKRLYKDDNTIDYGFFELQHIHLNVDNFLVFGPDISCKINSLSLSQYTGFKISSFSGNFRIYSQGLLLDDLHFTTPNSMFSGNFAFRYNSFSDYSDFLNRINFDTEVKCASVAMRDIIYFAPKLDGMGAQFVFSGSVTGPVNRLQTKNIFLKYNLQTRIAGDFAIENILDFKNSNVNLFFNDAYIDFAELAQFKLPKGKKINLPEAVKNVTYAKITGYYTGTFTKFNTHLMAQTNLGTVDAAIKTTNTGKKFSYTGTLACNNLDIGKLLNQPKYLNKINLQTSLEGLSDFTKNVKELLASLSVKIKGEITDVTLCGYLLKNLALNGSYSPHQIYLALKSTDSVASFRLKGNLKLAKDAPPVINASLAKVDIKLYDFFSHFPHHIDSTSVGFERFIYKMQQIPHLVFTTDSISIAMSGNQFENINGFVGIDYAKLTNGIKTSRIDWLRLSAINIRNLPHQYQIHTNAFNVSIKTNYNFKELVVAVENAAHFYLPKMLVNNERFAVEKEITSTDPMQFIDLDIKLFYSRNFFGLILPKLDMARDALVSVHLGKTRDEDYFSFSFPQISYAGLGRLNNIKANGKMNEQDMLGIQLQCDSLSIYRKSGNLTFSNIGIYTKSNRDEIQFMTSWRNPRGISVNELNVFSGLLRENASQDISLKITDSKLFLRESLWQFTGKDNTIHFGNNSFRFEHFALSSDVGRISINGEISKEWDKECNILLDNFDISLVNNLISKTGMTFEGNMSLMATITPNMEHFNVEGKTFIKNFVFNEQLLGDLFLDAKILRDGEPHFTGGILSSRDNLNINLSKFTYSDYLSLPNRIIELNGKFLTKEKELRVHADMDTLKIGFLSPFLSSFSNMVSGEASGHLDFVMNTDSLYFDGKVRVNNAQLGITPLNTIYNITDQDIVFNREGIKFERVLLKDKFKNDAILSGFIHHNKFKNFVIDLNISTQRIMVLNTPKKIDDSFFGDGFVSGDISIQGDTRQLNFLSHNIKTLSGSAITFPLNSTSSVSSSQGIYFLSNSTNKENTILNTRKSSTVLNFDFTFDITRDADVKLELDPIDGILKCKTSGKLHLTYNTNSGNMNLNGILSIVSGMFHMSLKNFFPRSFTIVEGGTISFAGPLTLARLNVSALYQKAASLRSLNPDNQDLSRIGRTDISAYLELTGNLMNPNPAFRFAFPRLNDKEQADVFSALDTANQQNGIRQFFSFVFLNTFITSEGGMTMEQSVETGVDMVSNMLSSFINNQFNNFSFGINFINSQKNYTEYSVNAQMNFLDDRIFLGTNLGYGKDQNADNTNNNFVADMNFGVWLNDARNWLLRLFFFNDVNQDPSRPQPQQGGGISISYRHEFNNRKDFLESWMLKKKEKKETSLKPIKNE